jgi:hypothetical protein
MTMKLPTLIPRSSMSRSLLVGSLAVVSVGCIPHFVAISTAGITYRSQEYENKTYLQAALGSGQHDLKCQQVTATELSAHEGEWAAEGCGQVAVYRCPGDGWRCQMLLVSKLAK